MKNAEIWNTTLLENSSSLCKAFFSIFSKADRVKSKFVSKEPFLPTNIEISKPDVIKSPKDLNVNKGAGSDIFSTRFYKNIQEFLILLL